MFSRYRAPTTHRLARMLACGASLLLLSTFGGCTKPAEHPAGAHAPITPQLDAAPPASATETLQANLATRSGASAYAAHFTQERLVRIEEERAHSRGVYEFQGARLLSYRGASLGDAAEMELRLDLQGRTTLARVGAREASELEIREIRERGELLRSHALAQRATRSHIRQTS